MNSIISKDGRFGIFWNEIEDHGWHYGNISILIGNDRYPKGNNAIEYTLETVFGNLKDSFHNKCFQGRNTGEDFGEKQFDIQKWINAELDNVFSIETSELSGESCINTLVLLIGYSGDTERLFFSVDNGDNFSEIRFQRGIIEDVISLLPSY